MHGAVTHGFLSLYAVKELKVQPDEFFILSNVLRVSFMLNSDINQAITSTPNSRQDTMVNQTSIWPLLT